MIVIKSALSSSLAVNQVIKDAMMMATIKVVRIEIAFLLLLMFFLTKRGEPLGSPLKSLAVG